MKVIDGVYRIDGVRASNAYIAETDDGLLVVDTGMSGNVDRITAFIRSTGYEPSDVRTIVITHADPDHTGGAAALRSATGAKIAIHPADAPVLEGTSLGRMAHGVAGVVLKLLRRVMRARPVEPDVLLRDGDTVLGFAVMHTPGHSPGSITLHRDGIVFAGDALLSDSKGHELPPSKALSGNYEQALESAEKIRGLKYKVLLTGHGAPVYEEGGDDSPSA